MLIERLFGFGIHVPLLGYNFNKFLNATNMMIDKYLNENVNSDDDNVCVEGYL